MSLKLHLHIWIINIFWMDLGVSLKIFFWSILCLKEKKMSLFHRWWIKNPIFFCCLDSFYWLNLQRQTDINKRWRRANTQGWKQQQQKKTLYTPKVCVEDPGIKKTWKIPVCLLEGASFSFHRCFDQSDTRRSRERAKQQKKEELVPFLIDSFN